MVISTVNQVVYNGDGITTAWPYTFRIIDWTDIKLTIIDADGTETDVTADYYVDTVNNTVYYPGYAPGAEPPQEDQPPKLQEGQRLVVYRELPITQEKNLGEKWPFYVIELALDKLTMILQQIFDWWGRTLKVSQGASVDGFNPDINPKANEVITVNADGDGFECREALMEVNGAWDGEGRQIKGVAGPALVKDAANKDYVDRILAGYSGQGDRFVFFDNVAQMQAAELVPSQMAVTLGYHDVNDGGAGVYTIRDIGADTPDGGSIIEIPGTDYVAELITDGTVNVKQFGAKCDGVTDDTIAIQNAINCGAVTVLFPEGEYIVSKNSDLNFTKHDEPCLLVKDKNTLNLVGSNATLHVSVHGQGILEVLDSENITINGIAFRGYGSFPTIGSPSGRCEKGTTGEGYYDTNNGYQWSLYKNNSVDTSAYEGFETDASQVWGTFGGGFIGNCGSGVLVYGASKNVLIENCEAYGFNHCGFEVGTRCVDTPVYSENITIRRCYAHDIYTSGIQIMTANNVLVDNNTVEKIGHPSAFTNDNGTSYAYNYVDPGYGITFSTYQVGTTYYYVRNGIAKNNHVSQCIRKGIDAHSGKALSVIDNYTEYCYSSGVEFSGYATISGYMQNCIIRGNKIYGCSLSKKGEPLSIIHSAIIPYEVSSVPSGNIIANNVLDECSSGKYMISCLYCASANVTGNIICNNVGGETGGIALSSENGSVVGNTINLPETVTYSIKKGSYGGVVENNTVSSAAPMFIYDYSSEHLDECTLVRNNQCQNSDVQTERYLNVQNKNYINIVIKLHKDIDGFTYDVLDGEPYVYDVGLGTGNIAFRIDNIRTATVKVVDYHIVRNGYISPGQKIGMSAGDYIEFYYVNQNSAYSGNFSIVVFDTTDTAVPMANISTMDAIFTARLTY